MISLSQDTLIGTLVASAIVGLFLWVMSVHASVATLEANTKAHQEMPTHAGAASVFTEMQKVQIGTSTSLQHLKERQKEQYSDLKEELALIKALIQQLQANDR